MISTGCKEQTSEERDFKNTKKLVEAGVYQSLFDLGMHYEKGIGVLKDEEKAIECYKRGLSTIWEEERKLPTTLEGWKEFAAKSEYNSRPKQLIGAYYDGSLRDGNTDIQITDKAEKSTDDTREAIKWYQEAIKDNCSSDCIGAFVRLAELSDSEKKYREYLESASQRESSVAKSLLSDRYLYDNSKYNSFINGKRIIHLSAPRPPNGFLTFMKGVRLLEEAAELGGSSATSQLSWIYNDYEGKYPIGRNESKAWMYQRQQDEESAAAYECNIGFLAQNPGLKLASMLPHLKEGTIDAFSWRIAALKGIPKAFYAVSVYHAYGRVFPKDKAEAIRLCRKSASLGYPLALMSMGNRYFDGNGVIKDEIEAYAYWNLAGCEIKTGHDYIEKMEKTMTESARLLGQKRSREIQAEIEANRAKIKSN